MAIGGGLEPGMPGVALPASEPPSRTTLVEPSGPEGWSQAVPHERSVEMRGWPVSCTGFPSASFLVTMSVHSQVSVLMMAESYLVGPATSTLLPPAPRVVVLGSTNMWGYRPMP